MKMLVNVFKSVVLCLVGALNGTGPFTVFAPTNEAFAQLPK